MLTYQIRQRRLVIDREPEFPAEGEVSFHFLPLCCFGMAAEGGRALVRPSPSDSPDVSNNSVFFNANTGEHYVRSKTPLNPLDVTILEDERRTVARGNRMTVRQRFTDPVSLSDFIDSIYFAMPVVLSAEFALW